MNRITQKIIFAVSICASMTINAIELKKIKIAAAVALAGVFGGNIITDPNPIATMSSVGNAFFDGFVTCSFLTSGSIAGNRFGHYVTPIGAYAGGVGGALLGSRIAHNAGYGTLDGIIFNDAPNTTKLDRIAQSVGCYCGSKIGVVATQAIFVNQ